MGERKVLNKYYPSDFDPAKIPRRRQPKNQQMKVRMMLPMSIRCGTCSNYIYKGTKFNSRKEEVICETYLGIRIFRFYFKCTKCSAELTIKTDPQNSDYVVESGASRNFEPWRAKDEEVDKGKQKRETEEMGDAMKSLENRTWDSKREMDILAALDEVKSMRSRQATIRVDAMLEILHVIAELLGFDNYIPPYSATRGEDILKGVNYASAAAGIRDETGQQLGARITMNGQVNNYKTTVSQVVDILGDGDSAANYLSQCIYSLGLGSNDYLNNYFMPTYYSTSRQYTPEQYAQVLIQQYSQQIRTLYNYGARKVVCIGVGQIGCSPNALAQNSPDGSSCVQNINSPIQLFNDQLKSLVDDFNNNLPGAKFIYINAYGIFQDLINRPSSFGFKVTNAGCCGVGRNNGQITCLPLQTPCQNRNEYLFWDAFHPSEVANIIVGRRSYSAESPSDAYPVDIRHLSQL